MEGEFLLTVGRTHREYPTVLCPWQWTNEKPDCDEQETKISQLWVKVPLKASGRMTEGHFRKAGRPRTSPIVAIAQAVVTHWVTDPEMSQSRNKPSTPQPGKLEISERTWPEGKFFKKILSRIYIEKIMKIHIIETNEIWPKWSSEGNL